MLSCKELRDAFVYRDGNLYWARKTGSMAAGSLAGNFRDDGYVRIKFKRRLFLVHIMIWVYHGRDIPDGYELDHINGDQTNNRIENLRLATHSENGFNAKIPSHSTSGHKGVSKRKGTNKWRAYITVNQRRRYLGTFGTIEEATAVRNAAAFATFGQFARETHEGGD